MKTFLERSAYAVLGIVFGITLPALAATQYTAGTLLQPGDVTTSHILNGTILNADVNATAGIIYSKLDLTGGIVNLDVSNTAAISALKIAGGVPAGLILLTNGTTLATTTNFSYATSTNKLTITGQLSVSASTTFQGVEYKWPTAQSASSTALMSDGAGKLIWDTPPVAASQPAFFVGTSTTFTTYTTPANATQLFIRICGGGGGGGDDNSPAGGAGGQTQFGTGTASTTAGGGGGGGVSSGNRSGGIGGTGGATAIGTEIIRIKGSGGGGGGSAAAYGVGHGGSSPFGGGGGSVGNNGTDLGAVNADLNSCSGGSGGAFGTAGTGGGAGEYVEFYINSPAATYSYNVGAAGTGGGGTGGTGLLIVQAFYH